MSLKYFRNILSKTYDNNKGNVHSTIYKTKKSCKPLIGIQDSFVLILPKL